ncbi:hypothetical protein BWZ22_11830 [Seonamhaeicola sp. S2-3]|uniref:SDR family oxidoreductase n=1 Tax=Seonamhaeicola sp. S2-3 TaxID=1936081 RepID=UPI0009729739|nr:SDR family oxidoreductase [Seonamhaeicola sp. S2-3]APY11877.1 hypothetical protein BWZ22_11830 [Seonamhaeicola sp. S2-3]
MPIYLIDVYGFNVKEVGMFLWEPYVGAVIGSIAGGYVSEKIIAKTNFNRQKKKNNILLGRLGQPEEVASVISFLVSDDAAFLTV